MQQRVSIIGGGLVGALWAAYMGQRGHRVAVFEKRPDMRQAQVDGGRSINLALSDRGLRALEGVGISTAVRQMAIPMPGRMIHYPDESLDFQPYGQEGQAINSISRAGLNGLLLDHAEKSGAVKTHFNTKSLEIDFADDQVVMENTGTGETFKTGSDLIFGTDGAFSAVRGGLLKTDRFDYSQHYLQHGYKELTIPPTADGRHRIEKHALHIWPRHSFMLIALPNLDGSFTCTLFLAFEGKHAFENLQTEAQVRAFFETHFPDAVPLMPTLIEDFFTNPTSSLVTARCYPWVHHRKIALLGDAAHAIVPFYGQGMNAGFEDCTLLNALIDQFKGDWARILPAFQEQRKPDADAIAELALRNFIEMRDKVADPQFLLRKKVERALHARYPARVTPVYSMVTFSHLPYSKALDESARQEELFRQIFRIPGIENRWDQPELLERMGAMLKELTG